MTLQWKEFHINLDLFKTFLEENIPNSDGIVASPLHFEIPEKAPFTPEEIALIQNYYDNLQPEVPDGEAN